ncbi:MAG: UDP-N-acetylmuramate--L-alanine ligase [Breznakibacter sp.]
MRFDSVTHLYFVGIGGIGMSALARFFNTAGRVVAGYDKTSTVLTRQLEAEGIRVVYDDAPDAFDFSGFPVQSTLVVYTPAVPNNHFQLNWLKDNGYQVLKRAQVLGVVSEGLSSICVAGTHGKTTVSTLTAHLLKQSSVDCHAFIGGISKNYMTNYLSSPDSHWVVLEADEFDRSFLNLSPQMAVVTSADADHLDIYGESKYVTEAFELFLGKVKPNGVMVVKKGLSLRVAALPEQRSFTYALSDQGADFYAADIVLKDGFYSFSLVTPNGTVPSLELGVPGLLNVENAVAASSMALTAGITPDELRKGLASFTGIKRRFDYWIKHERFCLIDDYAHHPEEINATAKSVRAIYPGKKIVAAFQPHLYSRTNDFHQEFAMALSQFDQVFLLDIYPARELPIPGVDSHLIAKNIKCPVQVVAKQDLAAAIAASGPDVVLTMGAGDIDQLLPQLKQVFDMEILRGNG